MFKVTPLDNGKFLIEPMESSLHQDIGLDQLSLIKKPVFEEESKTAEDLREGEDFWPASRSFWWIFPNNCWVKPTAWAETVKEMTVLTVPVS